MTSAEAKKEYLIYLYTNLYRDIEYLIEHPILSEKEFYYEYIYKGEFNTYETK